MKNRKQIGKFDITTGMIVTFAYQGYDKRPLVFVIDTDEYAPVGKKTFSGVNLNYLPISEVNNLFVRVLQKASWELDKKTKVPKVDLFDEENPGAKIEPIYNSIIKAPQVPYLPLLSKFVEDCINIPNTLMVFY